MQGGARANSPAVLAPYTRSVVLGFGPAPRGEVEVKLGRGAQKLAFISIQ